MDDMSKVIQWVKNEPGLVYDIEASGLDWHLNYPVGYVFCIPGKKKPSKHTQHCLLYTSPSPRDS